MTSPTPRTERQDTPDGEPRAVDLTGRWTDRLPGRALLSRHGIPSEVAAVTILFALILGFWSVAVPRFRAPDEPAHLDLVLFLAEDYPYPQFDGRFVGRAVGLSRDPYLIARDADWPKFSADAAPPRAGRPDVWDLGGTDPDPGARATPSDAHLAGAPFVYNQQPQHPPLYYKAMALALRVERYVVPGTRPPPLDRELAFLRLLNALLICPLPALAWLTAKRMGAGHRAALTASVLPLGLPQLTHIGSTLNNDNLLTLLAAVLAALLAGVARGRRSAWTDLMVGATLGLALLTKAFALTLVPWVIGAYALAWFAGSPHRRAVTIGLVRAGTLALVVGAWWWLRNLSRHGELASTSETLTRATAHADGFEIDGVKFVGRFVVWMASRSWVWIGFRSPKVQLPGPLIAVLTVLALAAVVIAVLTARRGPAVTGPLRRELLLALVPITLLFVVVARRAWGLQVTTGGYAFIQGRYLYAGIVPLMALVAIGANRVLGRRTPFALFALSMLLQGWTLLRVLHTAWEGPSVLAQLDSMLAWNAWPASVTVVMSFAAAAALIVAAQLIQRASRATESGREVQARREPAP